MTDLPDDFKKAANALTSAGYVIAMTGAGMSVESGIPTFRGPDGIWARHGPPEPNSYQKWLEDPDSWWCRENRDTVAPWIIELRDALDAATPNPGHGALAQLETMGVLQSVLTQNIDGLHQSAGSKSVIEIHGSRYKLRCVDCGCRRDRPELYMTEAPPPCTSCGGRVKFDSVLFGEPVPEAVMQSARAETDRADCVLVIGTSATVRPAGGLPRIAHANGSTLIEINPRETSLTSLCDISFRGGSAEMLPALLASI